MAFGSAEKGSWSQRHHSSWCVVRECGLEPLQFNWFCAAMRLYNSLTQCNSFTMRKVLQADMQLSSRSSECCSSHIFSAMEGLTQSYMFKQKLLSCEPIDLNRFVVDLRDRNLEFWTPFSNSHPIERNSKTLITSGVHCLHKERCLPILLIGFPGTCFLTSLEMSFTVWLVSDFVSTPFALKQLATWNSTSPPSPTCDLCEADDDVQDE